MSTSRIVCPDGRAVPLSPGATCEVGRGNLDRGNLGRGNLGHGNHVSRVQAALSLDAAGGTVLVMSLGTNPTGVRADPTAAWMWLTKGRSAQVSTSAQLCLDRKRTTTEALLTVELAAAPAAAPSCAAATSDASASNTDAAPATAAGARCRAKWMWQSSVSQDQWRPFSRAETEAIEAAWAANQERAPVDNERHVDLRRMK